MFRNLLIFALTLILTFPLDAQRRRRGNSTPPSSGFTAEAFSGLTFRGIGPAFMSGRIADIAIHPEDENTWYVAVGSGGVWKTINAGVTWTPIFDDQPVYSIGCVTIDSRNPNIVWVGTGENVGGRHVGFGDGIYKSEDGGQTWKNMGLMNSEHISEIFVHPDNSNKIYVAAQGPLWSAGGDRGFFYSHDGGATWTKTLGDDQYTGVTDIAVDPRNSDVIYAATWDHHRTVAAVMDGGPNTGIYRSDDGGLTWKELKNGLPESHMGKIGIAISPQQPDIIYAAIELDRRTGAVYRSADRGITWEKRSEAVSGATGPHYYQELYASPHHFEKLYLVDVRMQVSDDGGKTFYRMKEEHKHSDNHALAFRKSDPDYLLVGTDGGLYESFDLAENWRFSTNLPVTQFYKLAVDDAEPFYNIYGGTQDNNTQGGPSRTDYPHGISSYDWRVVLNWDGHQPATEPGNPNIMYAERQEGNLSRIDLKTGEVIDIQPQPGPDDPHERFNWDAPILVSPHDPARIYFASYRVWRSDNRGDKWTAISGDLTRNQERIELPIAGRQQSYDNAWDFLAMSNYNTITSLAESPLQEGLIYAGTDDGMIQVTEDGGASWRKIEVGSLPDVPKYAFVNDIRADLFDANTVYLCLDNHKYGDFKPYFYKSSDKGKSWTKLSNGLPEKLLVWRVVQDHKQKNLMFLATEFGIYFTIDGAQNWTKLIGGLPTISFRDITIHRREDDLIGASFGRGFYVYDDIRVFRELSKEIVDKEAHLFSTRDAWWYIEKPILSFDRGKGSHGASFYTAPNPPFGAVFTYHLKDGYKDRESVRKEKEKPLNKANKDIPFPGWDAVDAEVYDKGPKVFVLIKNQSDKVIRRISAPTGKGFHRVNWDLRYPAPDPIDYDANLEELEKRNPSGLLAVPGRYSATLVKVIDGESTQLSEPVEFEVKPMKQGSLEGASPAVASAFWRKYEEVVEVSASYANALENLVRKADAMRVALQRSAAETGDLDKQIYVLRENLLAIHREMMGSPSKLQVGEKTQPTINDRIFALTKGVDYSTYGPTETHLKTLDIIREQLSEFRLQINGLNPLIQSLETKLMEAGAPYIEGGVLQELK